MAKVHLHPIGLGLTNTNSLFQLDSVSTEVELIDDLLAAATMSSRLTKPDRSTSSETFCRSNNRSWYFIIDNVAGTASLEVFRSRPLMWLSASSNRSISCFGSAPFLLRDVEVHHLLGSILEVLKLLLQTYISNEQV
jgi:hypothetical protein